MTSRRPRIAVIFGGRSGEHGVSCLSAASVVAEIDRDQFDVVCVGITREGRWVLAEPEEPAADGDLPEVSTGVEVRVRVDTCSPALTVLATGEAIDLDVVFPLLHGPYGEDGTVQGLLELADLPYVGPGVLASAVAMDKGVAKRLLSAAGLPVAPGAVLGRHDDDLPAVDRQRLGLPLFVKPARGGSSLGVTRVTQWAGLSAALAEARRHDPVVVVESAVPGREVECAVLEYPDGHLAASLPATIRVGDGRFYDFEAKYLDRVTEFEIPARVDDAVTARIREVALEAFRTLGAAGLARVDVFVGDDGTVTINEINTMPGFTAISMYPQMWAATGLDYPDLITTLIRTAIARGTGLR